MATEQQPFEQFMKTREAAAQAYVRGDPGPLNQVVARDGPATFFAPGGGHCHGATAVATTYDQGARPFLPDGKTRFEVLQSAESGDLAFWTGIQRATVHMSDPQGHLRRAMCFEPYSNTTEASIRVRRIG